MPLILGRRVAARAAIGFGVPERTDSGDLLTYSGDGHLITFAPIGTGKTTGPVICNALNHPGQLIVMDVKGEVYAATAEARRKMGQPVHVIDLRDGGIPGSLNPLDLIARSGDDSAAIGRSFAANIVERGGGERDRFWDNWAETMISAAITHMLADLQPAERKLSGVFDLFHEIDVVYQLAVLLDTKVVKERSAIAAFGAFLQLPDRDTRPSVLGTVQGHVRLWDSDLVRTRTDASSMDIDALIAGEPMSLYIIVPPYRLHSFAPLLRTLLGSLIMAFTQRKEKPESRTLMLVDEVGNIGHMEALLTATTLLRSFGITLWTFWQNASQLAIYKEQANTLVDNAGVIQIFGARNLRMAQELASLVGGISADQILKMSKDEQVLLIESELVRAKQIRYYSDKHFKGAEKQSAAGGSR